MHDQQSCTNLVRNLRQFAQRPLRERPLLGIPDTLKHVLKTHAYHYTQHDYLTELYQGGRGSVRFSYGLCMRFRFSVPLWKGFFSVLGGRFGFFFSARGRGRGSSRRQVRGGFAMKIPGGGGVYTRERVPFVFLAIFPCFDQGAIHEKQNAIAQRDRV